ncbi:MAG: beta-N-acetylhexosaminidase [Phycisphaerales bacterium]|nr:MAG: beta-N-acetylhexosaminidase [Phycisphaerales bacterium]
MTLVEGAVVVFLVLTPGVVSGQQGVAQETPAAGVVASRALPAAVIPRPAHMKMSPGMFIVSTSTAVVVDEGDWDVKPIAEHLAAVLRQVTHSDVSIRTQPQGAAATGTIRLAIVEGDASLAEEGYELTIEADSVLLRAAKLRGLFWGVQTLRQLLPPDGQDAKVAGAQDAHAIALPCVHIMDTPRYEWRGMHLDVGRHFMPAKFVKRYIDFLALHKFNVFHWHLTEDQGWRLEIKKYPKLTTVAAWRGEKEKRYGGFYTQDEVREIVAYAAARFITVVPEIELPGHSLAALAAYPEFSCAGGPFEVPTRWGIFEDVYCAGNDGTFEFLENVLSEVLELFPGRYVHIGGDECPKTRWKACKKCQARIQAEGLADAHELQSYFIKRISRFLAGKGRRLVGWDEILEGGLAPDATVMSWRGIKGGIAAARMGHDVVMTPGTHCYLNMKQAPGADEPGHAGSHVVTLEKVYSFEPTPADLTADEAKHILGAQGNVWTEYIATPEQVEYMVFPRMCALAEVTWTPATLRDWNDFSSRLEVHQQRLDAMGVNYYRQKPAAASRTR